MGFSSGAVGTGVHGDYGTARTLGSQSGVAADEVELEHAFGTGASANSPFASAPFNTYVGRILILRPNTATQEYGLIVATSSSTRVQIRWLERPRNALRPELGGNANCRAAGGVASRCAAGAVDRSRVLSGG